MWDLAIRLENKPGGLPVALTLALAVCAAGVTHAAPPFDRRAWLEDYAYLKIELERSYANLAWFASPASGVDLPALDRRTLRGLRSAATDDDARTAIAAFIAGFHDGHLAAEAVLQPSSAKSAAPAKVDLAQATAIDACAALGYAPARAIAFSLPFEALPGVAMQADGIARVFRSAIATTPTGSRFGIVRIPRFRSQDAPPAGCLEAWEEQRKSNAPLDVDAMRNRIEVLWFEALAGQLKRFAKEQVAAVIVDVGGNTGGNDSGDWAARLLTDRPVRSPRLLIAADPKSIGYFDEQLEALRTALGGHADASAAARGLLAQGIESFEQRKTLVTSRACNLKWVWRERRPWDPAGCTRLIDAGFASGQLDYLDPGEVGDSEIAAALYWPATVDDLRGAWVGRVYVLTDGRTASSAEMFSAVIRDNRIGKTVGTATEGDGCGFMVDAEPVELPHSHLRYRVPNCVRLRADGSDEVVGIAPDLPVLPTQGEDARARAARVLEHVEKDLGGSSVR